MKKPLHIHQEVRANPNKLDKIPKCFFKEIDGSSFEILIQTKNVMYSEVQNVMQTSALGLLCTLYTVQKFWFFELWYYSFLTLFPLGKDTFYHRDSTVELVNKECGAK